MPSARSARGLCAVAVRRSCDVTYDVSTGLRFFKICHSAELKKIVEATAPVNPYDNPVAIGGRTENEIRTSYGLRKPIAGQM